MRKLQLLLTPVIAITLVAGALGQTSTSRELPKDYVSDGCSWFPDGNYCECCVEHDKAYFYGGSKKERRAADRQLFECVKRKKGRLLARMMWIGVRVGGVSFLPTSFRWGFGKRWDERKNLKEK